MFSKRLEEIVALIEPCNIFADIGTDHGYIAVEVIKKGLAKKAIATDLNEKPLMKAIQYANNMNLQNSIEFRISDGLDKIRPSEADVIVIAGMGGKLITNILEKGKDKILKSKLILQPMKDAHILRKWLFENGFSIEFEKVVFDKKYYIIIKTCYKSISYFTEKDFIVGTFYKFNKDEIALNYLFQLKNTIQKIINGKKNNNLPYNEEDKWLRYINEVIDLW